MTCAAIPALEWRQSLQRSKLGRAAKLVGMMLSMYWSPTSPVVFPSVTRLCEDCSSRRDFVHRGLRELEAAGFIEVTREVGQSNSYQLIVPDRNIDVDKTDTPIGKTDQSDTPTTVEPTDVSADRTLIRDNTNIPPIVPPKPKRARRSQLPSNWSPQSSHVQRAAQLGLDLNSQAEKFRLHAESTGRLMVNWNAAFTTWLIRASEWASKPSSGFRAGSPAEDPQNGVTEAARAQGKATRERMLAAKARKRKLKR